MKLSKTLAPLAVAVAALGASFAAQAALALRFSDGVSTFTVFDEGANDQAIGTAGIVAFSGTLFGNWTVTTGVGTSEFDPLAMHLTSSFSTLMSNFTAGESKVLTIEVGQTGLGLDGTVTFQASGGGSGDGLATWSAFADDNDGLFGDTSLIFSQVGYGNASGSAALPMTGPYSAMLRTTYDLNGITSVFAAGSLDLDLNVPEPGSVALVGMALLALGAAGRRRA